MIHPYSSHSFSYRNLPPYVLCHDPSVCIYRPICDVLVHNFHCVSCRVFFFLNPKKSSHHFFSTLGYMLHEQWCVFSGYPTAWQPWGLGVDLRWWCWRSPGITWNGRFANLEWTYLDTWSEKNGKTTPSWKWESHNYSKMLRNTSIW